MDNQQQCSFNPEPQPCKYSLIFDPTVPINHSFQKLTATLLKMFEEQADDFPLQMACIQQLRSLQLNYIPRDTISKVKDAESFRSLWVLLIDSPHCNCLDVRLLDAMAAASLKPEAKEIIDNFKNAYYNKTVAEVAPRVPIAPMKSIHCVTVYDNLNLDPNKITVFELYEHRFYIEEILEVGEVLGYHKIRIGSINIMWQIPIGFVYKAYCSLKKNHAKLNLWCALSISDIRQWEKLPVLWHGQQVDENKIGPIKSLLQNVSCKPFTLHSMFKWSSLEFNIVKKVNEPYKIEQIAYASCDEPRFPCSSNVKYDSMSNNCTMWITTHPGFYSDLYFGVRVCATDKLVGAALSYPLCITIRGKRIKAICIYKKVMLNMYGTVLHTC